MRTILLSPSYGCYESVIVYDLYILGSGVRPGEADPILVVDPYAVLSQPITSQGLQAIPWWNTKLLQVIDGIQAIEFPGSQPPQGARAHCATGSRVPAVEDILGPRIPE